MIGFLMWVRARNENDELRARLAKYEPPAPPPPPPSGKQHFAVFLFVFGLILLLLLIKSGCTTPPDRLAHFTSTRLK